MPLIAMSDYVDGVEELKALCGGTFKTYPVALNGVFGMGALGCGADCNCPCNQNKGVSGLGEYYDAQGGKYAGPPPESSQEQALQQFAVSPKGGGQAAPQSDFAKNFQAIADTLTKSFAQVAPAFKREPRPKVVVQHQQDNTTLYVIGGAVIVASVLAISVGKSGRK